MMHVRRYVQLLEYCIQPAERLRQFREVRLSDKLPSQNILRPSGNVSYKPDWVYTYDPQAITALGQNV